MAISINGLPRQALADDPIRFSVHGLPPHGVVYLDVELAPYLGHRWGRIFRGRADSRGILDPRMQLLDGSDVPDAILCSLDRVPSAALPRFAEAAALTISVRDNAQVCMTDRFYREFCARGVSMCGLPAPFAGMLYLPPGHGPHPAVVTVSGSGGGIYHEEAALLASRGFVCMALAYFNYPGRPIDLYEQPLEYFGTALRWLAIHPSVRADAIAVKGWSRGGELSLLLGATFPLVRAVVATVPSGYLWGAVRRDGRAGAAWTYDGKALPKLSTSRDAAKSTVASADGAVELAGVFDAAIARSDARTLENSAIPVERTNGPILLLCGGADAMWNSVALTDVVMSRTGVCAYDHRIQRHVYPEAGHSIRLPNLPVTLAETHPVSGVTYAYGGSRAGTAVARTEAWQLTLDFLKAALC